MPDTHLMRFQASRTGPAPRLPHRSRAIAFEISPIKYSFSVASSDANEDHLLIFKHEKLKNRGFLSQQAAELAKNFCQRHSEITWLLCSVRYFFQMQLPYPPQHHTQAARPSVLRKLSKHSPNETDTCQPQR